MLLYCCKTDQLNIADSCCCIRNTDQLSIADSCCCVVAVCQERWCRLRGNLLFYFKSRDQWSEPAGIFTHQCKIFCHFLRHHLTTLQFTSVVNPDPVESGSGSVTICFGSESRPKLKKKINNQNCSFFALIVQRRENSLNIGLPEPPIFDISGFGQIPTPTPILLL